MFVGNFCGIMRSQYAKVKEMKSYTNHDDDDDDRKAAVCCSFYVSVRNIKRMKLKL